MTKRPLSGALLNMQFTLSHSVDGMAAAQKAPGTDVPVKMARRIKEAAYFLRADKVGICRLPPYAVYSHSMASGEAAALNHKYAIAILIDQNFKTADARCESDWIGNSIEKNFQNP